MHPASPFLGFSSSSNNNGYNQNRRRGEYPILGTKRVVYKTAEQVLYAKDEQKNLITDERTVLFKSAVQTVHKKYDVLPLSLEDKDKHNDTYNLEVLVQKTKREHFKYDIHNVFTIVIPNDERPSRVPWTCTKSSLLYGIESG
jgi:hypothetical protein